MLVGLTGGIGSGKSTVAQRLRQAGVPVLDADDLAHALSRRGQPVWRAVWDAFSWAVLAPDGEWNRRRLARWVFWDERAREQLNALVHPAVRSALRAATEQLRASGAPLVVWDVPLLIEGGLYREVDEVWVVYAEPAQQVERILGRSAWSRAEALARVAAQWPLADKCAYADVILDNRGSEAQLAAQVEAQLARVRGL
jgi:dephospho-CoA kinase